MPWLCEWVYLYPTRLRALQTTTPGYFRVKQIKHFGAFIYFSNRNTPKETASQLKYQWIKRKLFFFLHNHKTHYSYFLSWPHRLILDSCYHRYSLQPQALPWMLNCQKAFLHQGRRTGRNAEAVTGSQTVLLCNNQWYWLPCNVTTANSQRPWFQI